VDVWGRIHRLTESEDATQQATFADLAAARLSVEAAVAESYFQLRILDTTQELFDDTIKAFQRSLQLTRNRYKAGIAARNDVVQSETQLHRITGN
jgi:outer membrane protein TolC